MGTTGYMTGLGSSNLGFSTGLFDFGPSRQAAANNVKDAEICRLREELLAARSKLQSWEEPMVSSQDWSRDLPAERGAAGRQVEAPVLGGDHGPGQDGLRRLEEGGRDGQQEGRDGPEGQGGGHY